MEKTYKLLEHEHPISYEEVEKLYNGYWVYLVKTQLTETNGIISGIPVVAGLCAYDGAEDGVYTKYKTEEYVQRVGVSLLPNRGFISSLRFTEQAHG